MNPQNPLTVQVDYMGVWHSSIFFGLISGLIFLCTNLNLIPWIAKALFLYVSAFALFILEFPAWIFGSYNTAFQATSGQALAEILIISVMAIAVPFRVIKKILPVVVIGTIVCVWMNWDGLMIAPSFNTALIALALPFVTPWLWIPSIITIATHHGSTAMLIVIFQLSTFALKNRRFFKYFLGSAVVFAGLMKFHSSSSMLDGGERIAKWTSYMSIWSSEWLTTVFGVGPGTFMWMSIEKDAYRPPLFLMMHSDWLQITFEWGLIGLGLTIGSFFVAVRRSWNNPPLLCGLFGLAAFMMTYHPWRFFPSAFLAAVIVAQAFKLGPHPAPEN